MTAIAPATTWFNASTRVEQLADASFIFGGTHLLREFLSRASACRTGGRVLIVSPFVETALLGRSALFEREAASQFDLLLITTPAAARSRAARELRSCGWRTCKMYALRGLHAKLYVFLPERGHVHALIGSHNLTSAAAFTNSEAGVLISGASRDTDGVVRGIIEHIASLKGRASCVPPSSAHPAAPSLNAA